MSCPVASTPTRLARPPCEFSARYWLLDLDWRDVSGRFLAEGKHPAAFAGDMDLVGCPYSDRRRNHALPINASALKAVARNLAAVLGGVRHLRDQLPAARGTSLSCRDALWVTAAAACLPAFEWRAAGSPLAWAVPDVTASLYKICIGAVGALMAMELGMWARGQGDSSVVTAVQLYKFIEANELLVGRNEVCAGSPSMIRAFVEALLDPVPPALACGGSVPGIELHGPALLNYAAAVLRIEWAKRGFTFCHHLLVMHALRQPSLADSLRPWRQRRDAWLAAHDPHAAQLEAFCATLGASSQMRVLRGIEQRARAAGAMPRTPSGCEITSPQALRVACGELRAWMWRQIDAMQALLPPNFVSPSVEATKSREALSIVLGPLLDEALAR